MSTESAVPMAGPVPVVLEEVLPKSGLVFSERGNLTEVLCKPKILPLKSATLLRMEQLETKARDNAAAEAEAEAEAEAQG